MQCHYCSTEFQQQGFRTLCPTCKATYEAPLKYCTPIKYSKQSNRIRYSQALLLCLMVITGVAGLVAQPYWKIVSFVCQLLIFIPWVAVGIAEYLDKKKFYSSQAAAEYKPVLGPDSEAVLGLDDGRQLRWVLFAAGLILFVAFVYIY
jgi:hypothetical protein